MTSANFPYINKQLDIFMNKEGKLRFSENLQ